MLLRLVPFSSALMHLAQAEVAVGHQRFHAARRGQHQRPKIVSLTALGVELVSVGCNVPEQVQSVSHHSWSLPRIFNRAVGQTLGIVWPAEN